MKLIAAVVLISSSLFSIDVSASVPIDRFYEVSPGIYRGARPGYAGVKSLSQMGVKTILNIDDEDAEIIEERAISNDLGIEMISVPLTPFWTPDDQDIDLILATLADTSKQPIFVHCEHGRDRTGLVVGLYRVLYEGWEPEDAYEEMIDKGFRKILVFLDEYFEDRTGYDD